MKTYNLKAGEIEKAWHVLDAENVPLGRLASRAATLLRGKHKPTFTPHLDMGDFVVVVNAEKVKLSSNEVDKKYYRHSGYPGGLRERSFRDLRATHPARLIEAAVKGMLPHNRLGSQLYRHLKVYAGATHPHEAQLRAGAGARAQRRHQQDEAIRATIAERAAAAAIEPEAVAVSPAAGTAAPPASSPKPRTRVAAPKAAAKEATEKPKRAPRRTKAAGDEGSAT